MSNKMQNGAMIKLKQSLIDKQCSHRFNQLLNTNIRINKDEVNNNNVMTIQTNALLPSISNTKATLTRRHKSYSAKKISSLINIEKNANGRSTKKLINQGIYKIESNHQGTKDLDEIVLKKQSLGENSGKKGSVIRTKLFSLKTPSQQVEKQIPKEVTRTKDMSMNVSGSQVQKSKQIIIRQFNSKMDRLSEELYICLKNGKIDVESPDNKKIVATLVKLKGSNEDQFRRVQLMMQKLVGFIDKNKIANGNIQFKKIVELSKKRVVSNFQFVNTFINKEQIIASHRIVGLQFYTQPSIKGHQLAANTIISLFKMIFSKKFYKNLAALMKKVKVIQKYWRMCLLVRKTRRDVMANINLKIQKHSQLQQKLINQWNLIRTSPRFEIHICSYSLQEFKRMTIKSIKQRENNQITRIFRAMETDVNVIYVAPFQIHQQIMKYYQSIFNFNPIKMQEKIYFIVPQNRQKIQKHCSITTATALYYSPKALKRIRQIISGSYAFIVPYFPSVQYINISATLGVAIMGPSPNVAKLFSTKSGCLKIFGNVAKKQKSPFCLCKSVQGIYSEKQLINTLSIMIFKNKQVKIWYLKIQDQINSRGLAYLNIEKIAFLRQVCSGGEWKDFEEKQMIKLIADELTAKLKNRLKILNKDVYPSYQQYLSHFLTRGGLVSEGFGFDKPEQFSISYFIEPSGQFKIIGTYNKLQLGGKSISQGINFPSEIKEVDYEGITRNLYKEMYVKRKLFGYFTADFLFSVSTQAVTAIGLDCFLNQKTSALFMVNYCARTSYNKDRNSLVNIKHQDFVFTYCPSLSLVKLPATSTFFKNCKFENISFDLQKKIGTFFVLIDKLQCEQLGFVIVEENWGQLLRQMRKLIDYCCRQFRDTKKGHDEIGLLKGVMTTALKRFERHKSSRIPNLQQKA